MVQEMAVETPRAAGSPPASMTYEEFLQWDGENQHVEWVNRKVVYMSPVTSEHQMVAGWLLTLLSLGEVLAQAGMALGSSCPLERTQGVEAGLSAKP